MNFSVLTYNTLFNKAFLQFGSLIDKYQPDILCLQEVNTDSDNLQLLETKGYSLADYSNSFIELTKIYGVVTYYNSQKFRFIKSDSLTIKSNLSEFFFTLFQTLIGINKPKTVLRTDFIHKSSGKKLIVCNTHLIVIASNALRVNHLNKALRSLKINQQTRLIIGGDFNYLPYQRRKLENIMKKYGLIEATKNIRQTFDFSVAGAEKHMTGFQHSFVRLLDKLFSHKMKNDYVFYKGLKLIKTERIEVHYSDHYPILSNFSI
ncbi:MAG: endonuclease/exonuclease/phosphatase family protein [Candidatus Roizmanbacteria bacterium]